MTVGDSLQLLADTAKAFEEEAYEVAGIASLDHTNGLSSEISVEIPVLDAVPELPGVNVLPSEATVLEDGTVIVDFTVDIEAAASNAVDQRDEAAYKDPARLQAVYDLHDTFKEMRDALGADVTPKTVRNHMVKHGIHEIGSDTASSSSTEDIGSSSSADETADSGTDGAAVAGVSEPVADGAGLPEDVSLDDLKEIVRTSTTLYEVQKRVGLERGQVHQILQSLNLLDLVYGRISNPAQDVPIHEIDERIQRSPLFSDLSG